MFEKSPTFQRYVNPRPRVVRVHLGHVPALDEGRRRTEERSALRTALVAALLLHGLFFLVTLPELAGRPEWTPAERPVFAVRQVRFRPPPPAAEPVIPRPRERRRVIPVPDPTPDEPEPLAVEYELPAVEIADLDLALGIPESPGADLGPAAGQPLPVGGDVLPPEKLFGPPPPYTEEARQGRIQGLVILEAIIDVMGQVTDVRVLKGLPMGLTESAVEVARTWKYRPATRNGLPVPVFFNLTIRFSLQ